MSTPRRFFLLGILVIAGTGAVGCTGADAPKMVDAPPPTITEADKAEPKGKPPGYGTGDLYQKSMNKSQ